MGLTVTVLGCDGGYPGPGGAASGYLVQGGGATVWLDAGHGTLANLQRHVDVEDLDAVVLSHEHPDHWADLEGLAVILGYELGRKGLAVHAPAGLRARVYHDPPGFYDWCEVADGDRAEVGGLVLRFSRTDHGPETLAVRVDGEGRSLGYSADTGPGWSLAALGGGLDLALCEATYLESAVGSGRHLTAHQAGAMARDAGVSRLVVTHRSPRAGAEAVRAEASEAFAAAVAQAAVDAVLEI
ncbi:MAG: MBL fold metallo-hydrolase [Acidimicrobiales bacterium]